MVGFCVENLHLGLGFTAHNKISHSMKAFIWFFAAMWKLLDNFCGMLFVVLKAWPQHSLWVISIPSFGNMRWSPVALCMLSIPFCWIARTDAAGNSQYLCSTHQTRLCLLRLNRKTPHEDRLVLGRSVEQPNRLCMPNESFLSASKEKHTQMTHL